MKPGRAYEHVQRKLTEQERTALRESLQTHGQRDEIILDQHNDIIDGYNREDLCRELGIEPRYVTLHVDDPVYWILHNQTARRNLGAKEMRELIVETKAKDPTASTRDIAEKLGASKSVVAKVLKNTGAHAGAPVIGKDGKTYKPKRQHKPSQADLKLEAALRAYDRRKAAGEEITYEALQQEAGTSSMPVRRAIAMRKGAEEVEQQAEIVLSASAQEKLDAKLRAHQRQLDLEFETRVLAESRKRLDEWDIPHYLKTLRKVEQLLEWRKGGGVMSRADYRKIMRCIHPDTGAHVSDEIRNEAFRLFNQYEAKLVSDNEQVDIKKVSTLPRTVEEMMARRRRH